jgi:hypothetical protein
LIQGKEISKWEIDKLRYTRIKEGAKEMEVATKWKDRNKFEDLLVERIVGPVVKP